MSFAAVEVAAGATSVNKHWTDGYPELFEKGDQRARPANISTN